MTGAARLLAEAWPVSPPSLVPQEVQSTPRDQRCADAGQAGARDEDPRRQVHRPGGERRDDQRGSPPTAERINRIPHPECLVSLHENRLKKKDITQMEWKQTPPFLATL